MTLGNHHKYVVGRRLPNGSFKPISACEKLEHAHVEHGHAKKLHGDVVEIHQLDEESGEWLKMAQQPE